MNPTQYELARLAAMQAGTPHQRAQAALALWKACGDELERDATFQKTVTAEEERRMEVRALFPEGETVSLEEFQRAAMPNSKPEDRAKNYRDWVRGTIAHLEKLQGSELETATAEAIARWRETGYPFGIAGDFLCVFQRYLARKRSEKNTERAKKGAAAKKLLGVSKSPKKAPQAKRKTRQAKR